MLRITRRKDQSIVIHMDNKVLCVVTVIGGNNVSLGIDCIKEIGISRPEWLKLNNIILDSKEIEEQKKKTELERGFKALEKMK